MSGPTSEIMTAASALRKATRSRVFAIDETVKKLIDNFESVFHRLKNEDAEKSACIGSVTNLDLCSYVCCACPVAVSIHRLKEYSEPSCCYEASAVHPRSEGSEKLTEEVRKKELDTESELSFSTRADCRLRSRSSSSFTSLSSRTENDSFGEEWPPTPSDLLIDEYTSESEEEPESLPSSVPRVLTKPTPIRTPAVFIFYPLPVPEIRTEVVSRAIMDGTS